MRRVFVTGSTTGLGRAAAEALLDDGHDVVLHARSVEGALDLGDLGARASGVVVGDLGDAADVRSIADQANGFGPFDAVIHNAAIYVDRTRVATAQMWLDVSNDRDATVTGKYWHHQQIHAPASAVNDPAFQEAVLDQVVQLTGIALS